MRLGLVLLGLILGISSCSAQPRPSPETWGETWSRVRAVVPEPAAFHDASDVRQLCGRVLGDLHQAREELFPAPDDDVARVAEAWLEFAEQMVYECPTRADGESGFDADLERLGWMAAEVDARLEAARSRS